MNEAKEQMIYNEGYRRGKEEATKELMAWHDRVCEEMAKHHTADRPMLDDGTLVISVDDATAVTRVLVEDSKKNGDLYYADRPKGEWIYCEEEESGQDGYACSECGFFVPWNYDTQDANFIANYYFCPFCSADMKGDNNAD